MHFFCPGPRRIGVFALSSNRRNFLQRAAAFSLLARLAPAQMNDQMNDQMHASGTQTPIGAPPMPHSQMPESSFAPPRKPILPLSN